jgi:SAM-dependent methyltransferase
MRYRLGMTRPAPRYLQPYVDAAAKHGGTFEAQLWRSREAQAIRFDTIVSMVGEATFRDARVVDLGCGCGDFAAHLSERGIAIGEGIGLEAVPELLRAAQDRRLAKWTFIAGDFVADREAIAASRPDLCVLSGSLNTLSPRQVRTVIDRAISASRLGVAFNFLSDRSRRPAGEDLRPARRFDTLGMLRFAFSRSPRVAFRQDHLDGHDGTIWIARPDVAVPTAGGHRSEESNRSGG